MRCFPQVRRLRAGRGVPVEINQLRFFLASCEGASFAKAAEATGTSRQAVSNSVRSLESEMGVQLFERKHNQMRLTAEGERVARRAQRVISLVDDLYNEEADGRDELVLGLDSFVIGSMTDPFDSLIEYASAEGGCFVRVAQDPFESMKEMLLNGRRDLLILRSLSSSFDGCAAVPLRSAKLGLIVSGDDPLAARDALGIEDVRGRTLIVPNGSRQRYKAFFDALAAEGRGPKVSYVDNSAMALAAIKKTKGVGMTDFDGPPERTAIGGCFKIPFAGEAENVRDCAVYPLDSPKKDQITHFVRWLQDEARFLKWHPSVPIS